MVDACVLLLDGVSIVELRPLVIMARSALSTLSALASSLYLSLEGAEYPVSPVFPVSFARPLTMLHRIKSSSSLRKRLATITQTV